MKDIYPFSIFKSGVFSYLGVSEFFYLQLPILQPQEVQPQAHIFAS